ncbi:MAG: hypothetical protein RL341_2240, partial [Pseudomonadota bacterium]
LALTELSRYVFRKPELNRYLRGHVHFDDPNLPEFLDSQTHEPIKE